MNIREDIEFEKELSDNVINNATISRRFLVFNKIRLYVSDYSISQGVIGVYTSLQKIISDPKIRDLASRSNNKNINLAVKMHRKRISK